MSKVFTLFTTGLEVYAFYFVIGKLITSITHAIFYVLLYYVYRIRRGIKKNFGQKLVYMSTLFLRIIICLCPKNNWAKNKSQLI